MALQAFSRSKTSRKWAPFRVGATAPIQPRYRAAFAFSDLLYPHFQQPSLRSTCPCSTSQWRKYGLTEFHNHHKSGLGPACSPVTRCQRVPRCKKDNQSRTFWSKPVSNFGSMRLTVFISSSLTLAVPPSLASRPRVARRVCMAPRGDHTPQTSWDCIVRTLRTPPLPATHCP